MQEYPPPYTPNQNTNGQFIQVTTPKPTRTTTINSFWSEWSAEKPTNLHENEIDRHSAHAHDSNRFHDSNEMFRQTTPATFVHTTTPDMASWMVDILNEYSSTTTPRSQFNQNNNQNNRDDHTTTEVAEMLPWMRDVLNEYSTTTTRKNIRFENDNTKQIPSGGGNGGGRNNNGDLRLPIQNRYSM